jgi:hypothetical protein
LSGYVGAASVTGGAAHRNEESYAMSVVGKTFADAFGAPDPATPNGLMFKGTGESLESTWEFLRPEVGSGWFRDGFLYLFGEGLETLAPCVDAWSAMVPPNPNRMILGRTAYGAIFLLENPGIVDEEQVHVLDAHRGVYWSDPNIMFVNFIGAWLPKGYLPPHLLADKTYQAWRKKNGGASVALDQMLAPKSLIGVLDKTPAASALQLENIVDYYRRTASNHPHR